MAISNLNLNVRANTARAMRDFKRFSDTIDNKFLLSGLKLDVVRNALSQINREFQRSIGEQGLASASSLRAAQNQAALLTATFKGFAAESAMAINRDIGTALNSLAVRTGGTMKDIQQTLRATPFISTQVSTDLRDELTKGIMSFSRDMRRAGLTENFGGIAQQFLSGKIRSMDMINSMDPATSFIGAEILKKSGGRGEIYSAKERTEILAEVLGNPEIIRMFKEMARRTAGYRIILEDLNTRLFNPEKGIFGSLRRIATSVGVTTMFDQVERLVNTVFGPDGTFASFWKRIAQVFQINDPMQPLLETVIFVEKMFNRLKNFFESEGFGKILGAIKIVFDEATKVFKSDLVQGIPARIGQIFKEIGNILASPGFKSTLKGVGEVLGRFFRFLGDVVRIFGNTFKEIGQETFQSGDITKSIKGIGDSVRKFIRDVGKGIRDQDISDSKEGKFLVDIASTLLTEVGQTTVVLIKEIFATLIKSVPEIAKMVLPGLNSALNTMLNEMFGEVGAKLVKFVLGFVPGPIGAIARASAIGDVTGGGGSMASIMAMGAGALFAPRLISRIVNPAERFRTMGGLGERAQSVDNWINRVYGLRDETGRNRLRLATRLSGRASRLVSPSSRRPDPVWEDLFTRSGGWAPPEYWSGHFDPRGFSGTVGLRDLRTFRTGFIPRTSRGRGIPPRGDIPLPNTPTRGNQPNWPFSPQRITQETSMFNLSDKQISNLVGREIAETISGRITRNTTMFTVPIERNITGMRVARRKINMSRPKPEGFGGRRDMRNRDRISSREEDRRLLALWETEDMDAFMERYREDRALRRILGGGLNERFMRRYGGGIQNRMGLMRRRLFPRFRGGRGLLAGGLAAGGLFAVDAIGRSSQAQELMGNVQENVSGFMEKPGLGGMAKGAMEGAQIGMILGPKGAAIGAVIGAAVSLFDEGTRKGVMDFISGLQKSFMGAMSNLSRGFTDWVGGAWKWFADGTRENFKRAQDILSNAFKFVVNGFIKVFNTALSGFQILPRLIMGIIEAAYNNAPDIIKAIPGLGAAVKTGRDISNFQFPTMNYGGRNFYGPALAQEARMSGRRPMVVNSGEFVIPSGSGLSTLSNLVGQQLRNTDRRAPAPTQISVNLVVNSSALVADANQLANALRQPVYQIIDDAWKHHYQTISYTGNRT